MPYLSVLEYVDRFGERETTLLTNDEVPIGGGPATYDSAKVEAAIEDAEEEVNGYIGKRYGLPLPTTPSLVKGWTAALARLKLAETSTRVGEAIEKAADRAYAQLKDLVANRLDLPIPDGGTTPAPVNSGSAISSGDRPRSTFGSLDGFTAPFTGDPYPSACWRRGG